MALQPPEGGTPTDGPAPGLQAQWFAQPEKREAPRFFWSFDDSVGTVSFMPPPPTTHPDLEALFEFTRARVIQDDRTYGEPNDPRGWEDGDLWENLLQTAGIPDEEEFELAEVVCLTAWLDAEGWRNPERYKAFRRFTCSLALIFLQRGFTTGEIFPAPNYVALNLLRDLTFGDPELLKLLRGAFAAAGSMLQEERNSPEYPFFILGELLLAQFAGDRTAASRAASKLLAEEEAARVDDATVLSEMKDDEFLFPLTSFDRFEADWRILAAKLENPQNDPHIARVIHLFAGGSR